MWISLAFDGVIALLLGVTIFYCTLVNRRLGALRSSKDELKQVIEDLTVATTKAQMSISHLREAGEEVVGTLEDDVRKGRALADELALMVEAGNNLANRLEGGREHAARAAVSNADQVISDDWSDDRVADQAVEKLRRLQPRETLQSADTRVRPRVQVKPLSIDASVEPVSKPIPVDSGVENELLKALRRAR